MGIIETVTGAVVAPVLSAIGGFVYKNRQQAQSNSEELADIKQRLFGYDEDDTDQGVLMEMQDQMEEMEQKLDKIDSKLDNNGNVRHHTDLSNFEPENDE